MFLLVLGVFHLFLWFLQLDGILWFFRRRWRVLIVLQLFQTLVYGKLWRNGSIDYNYGMSFPMPDTWMIFLLIRGKNCHNRNTELVWVETFDVDIARIGLPLHRMRLVGWPDRQGLSRRPLRAWRHLPYCWGWWPWQGCRPVELRYVSPWSVGLWCTKARDHDDIAGMKTHSPELTTLSELNSPLVVHFRAAIVLKITFCRRLDLISL